MLDFEFGLNFNHCFMPIQKPPYAPRPKVSHVEIYWKTVTYRTVAMYLFMVFAVVLAILYLIFPETFSGAIARISEAVGGGTASTAVLTAKQAKFVNLDGRVQVKKVNSVQWVTADYRMALDKGDLIQTGGDGAARITLADGTTSHRARSDTLVTVEEKFHRPGRGTAKRASPCTSLLARWTWQPVRGIRRNPRPKFPSRMP